MYFYRGVRKKTNPRFDFWVDVLMSCFLDFLTLKISVINSSRVQKLQNFSEEVLMMSETCLNFWGTKFGPWMDARLEKKWRFCARRSKNQNKSRTFRNPTELGRSSTCIFVEMPAKNQLKIRFLGRCFDVMLS